MKKIFLYIVLTLVVCSVTAQTQDKINVGTGPNTKTGDPLRAAFIKVNKNDSALFALISAITPQSLGLGLINNTSDANKPISTATQAALNLKAPLASPAFTGTPTGITAAHVGAMPTSHAANAITGWGASGTATTVARTDDARFTDVRTPVGHNQAESTITFTDILTGNASITKHGYLPKLGGGTTNFLRSDGTWAAPDYESKWPVNSSGSDLLNATFADGSKGYFSISDLVQTHAASHITGGADVISNFTRTASGMVPAAGGTNGTTKFLREDGSFAVPAVGDAWPVNGSGKDLLNATFADGSKGYYSFDSLVTDNGYYNQEYKKIIYFNDFHSNGPDGFIAFSAVGTGATTTTSDANTASGALGIIRLITGTTATGYVTLRNGLGQSFYSGNGKIQIEYKINLPTLSNATNGYIVRMGLGDQNGGDFIDGAYFEYLQTTSADWYYCRAANSARTKTTTGVPVETTNYHNFKIVISEDGATITYYIDGVQRGQYATVSDLQGVARAYSPYLQIISTLSTAEKIMHIDWFKVRYDMTTRAGTAPSF
jgi:hypothetical protein